MESFALGAEEEVEPYDLSPDGRLLATTTDRIQVRELPGRRTVAQLFYDSIADLKFDREGRRIALVEGGGAVRILEVSDSRELARIRHLGEVTALSFSPSGKYLSILNDQGRVQASPLHPEDLLAAACARVTRNLEQAEWEHYLGPNIPPRKTCLAVP